MSRHPQATGLTATTHAAGSDRTRLHPQECVSADASMPTPVPGDDLVCQKAAATTEPHTWSVVLCGSFRRDQPGLQAAFAELTQVGCTILSPPSVEFESETDGFVVVRGETEATPTALVSRHLDAIAAADLVWLHAPEGYVGLSTSLEIGFAMARGVPIFAPQPLRDVALMGLVRVAPTPLEALGLVAQDAAHPARRGGQAQQGPDGRREPGSGARTPVAGVSLVTITERLSAVVDHLRGRPTEACRDDLADDLDDLHHCLKRLSDSLGVDLGNGVWGATGSGDRRPRRARRQPPES